MERRKFFKIGAAAAAISAFDLMSLQTVSAANAAASDHTGDLVAVKGDDPALMMRRAIEELGGIGQFVKPGDKVVLKPNIGWAKPETMGANTNPDVVGALTKLCMDHGAKQVLVLDHTCHEWKACYEKSGIEQTVKENGGKMAPANVESYFETVQLPKGKVLKETTVHKAIVECDVWFNIAQLKHHSGAKMSVCMKNLMGINWDRQYFHRKGLHQCIADINTWEKPPVLHIVDAYRTLTQNGPQGKGIEDVVLTKSLFASKDPVAVDTAAVKFFNQYKPVNLDDVAYLKLGEEANVGSMDLSLKTIKRVEI